ncbi:MAG: type II toxin-antitoxin system VapB family antitoxin [Alphaproteobacteria bacterium]|nr:type II toxin-antitoxin system VapB family antitoxin [Alphaproteobacteria bacterium]MBV9692805.1 type II toxin-antitoxin system VapB family antitoxin [Alphaproteobacteria bacterium]
MGINIKNAEAERLIKELSELTGESQTTAVAEAVRERIARLKRRGLSDRLMAIAEECAARLKEGSGKMMEIEDLYDPETGLPI